MSDVPLTLRELGLDGTLKQAVERLYYWQYKSGTSFTSQLFNLLKKADPSNKRRLAQAFPDEAEALRLWEATDGPMLRSFFESWMGPLAPEDPPHTGGLAE